jgi:hypothetical protein
LSFASTTPLESSAVEESQSSSSISDSVDDILSKELELETVERLLDNFEVEEGSAASEDVDQVKQPKEDTAQENKNASMRFSFGGEDVLVVEDDTTFKGSNDSILSLKEASSDLASIIYVEDKIDVSISEVSFA